VIAIVLPVAKAVAVLELPVNVAVTVPALKSPLASRATIALAVFADAAVVAELLTFDAVEIVASLVSSMAADAFMSALTITPAAIEVALPTEVTSPVRFALVVTLPAVKPAAVPVTLVIIPEAGVPKAGATRVLLDSVSVPASVAKVPLTTGNVIDVVAPCTNVVLNAPVVAKLPANASVPVVTVTADPPAFITSALLALPESVGKSANPAVIRSNSARKADDAPGAPVVG